MRLFGTSIDKEFYLNKISDNNQGGLYFAANSANEFKQRFAVGNNWTPVPARNSEIKFSQGAAIGTYFRPDMTDGGVKMIFSGKASSFGTGAQFYGGRTYFEVSSNTIDSVYVRVNTTLDFSAPNVFVKPDKSTFPDLYMHNESGVNPSYIRLNGFDQSFGNLSLNNPKGDISTPAGMPATFSFKQTTDVQFRKDMFTGPISLSKGGAATVTIAGNMEMTGSELTVRGGRFEFTENGVLGSVTNVVVKGESSVLVLAASTNLPQMKKSVVQISDGGKLELSSGVALSIGELFVDGRKISRGTYNSGNASAFIEGEGEIQVGGPGLYIIVR